MVANRNLVVEENVVEKRKRYTRAEAGRDKLIDARLLSGIPFEPITGTLVKDLRRQTIDSIIYIASLKAAAALSLFPRPDKSSVARSRVRQ